MDNIGNFDWELAAKHLVRETNEQEKAGMEDLLKQNAENKETLVQSQTLLNKIDTYYQANKFDSNSAWKNVNAQIDPKQNKTIQLNKKRKEVIAQFYKYAAVVVVALLLGSIGYYIGFRNQDKAIYSEVISGNNQVLNEYVLPDGSVVALNSNSKLLFPKQFEGNTREVTIIGEAFFDVKRDPEKPFVINAGDAQVKVLGTSFNVCAYPGAKTVEVIVETGKVQVINKTSELLAENREVFLTPGEKGTLLTANHILEKTVNTNPNFLSWKTQDLIFNQVPLSEVVRCLEKTYHIDIDITEPELNDLLYKGHFDQKPAEFVLNVIRLTFDLEQPGDEENYTLRSRANKQ